MQLVARSVMDIVELICKVKVALSAVFALDDGLCLSIEPLYDVHQTNGNKLQKFDGCPAQLDYESQNQITDNRFIHKHGRPIFCYFWVPC